MSDREQLLTVVKLKTRSDKDKDLWSEENDKDNDLRSEDQYNDPSFEDKDL